MLPSYSRAIYARLAHASVHGSHSAKCSVPSSCPYRRVACRNLNTDANLSSHRSANTGSSQQTWDSLFSNVPDTPPQIPSQTGIGPRRPRRQTMTAHEINAFNEIFNMIFDSMSEKGTGPGSPVDTSGGMGKLFGTMRRHSKRMKWTAQSDETLDRKKDEMDRCETDQQLLSWALTDVFGEFQQYEEEWNNAKADGAEVSIQPPAYPHLVPLLMQTFRDKYRDPHLALSMFDYARQLSILSYVFGCSTSAYNELIATRWTCFRDLKGVHDALEEMAVNGVDMDNKTQELIEKVRVEVGEKNLWMEENEFGAEGVWAMLNDIEMVVNQTVVSSRISKAKSRNKTTTPKNLAWNAWRAPSSETDTDWEFNKW